MKTVAERTLVAYNDAVKSLKDLYRLARSLERKDTLEARGELRALQGSLAWVKKACDYLHRMHVNSVFPVQL